MFVLIVIRPWQQYIHISTLKDFDKLQKKTYRKHFKKRFYYEVKK